MLIKYLFNLNLFTLLVFITIFNFIFYVSIHYKSNIILSYIFIHYYKKFLFIIINKK
jgi:hypothetical protein